MENYEEEFERELKNKINSLNERTSQQLDIKLNEFEQNISKQIDEYLELPLNKKINEKCQNILYHTNSILDYILICLSNIEPLVSFILGNKSKELQKIINQKKPNNFFNLFVELFTHLWFKKEDIYDATKIHKLLYNLDKDIYKSTNPGKIISFLLSKLHDELNFNNDINNENNINYTDRVDKKKVLEAFKISSEKNKTDISKIFFINYRIKKRCSVCQSTNIYFFEKRPIVDLYIQENKNGIGEDNLSLSENYNFLLNDYIDREDFCPGCRYVQKMIINNQIESYDNNILIININRENDINHKKKISIFNELAFSDQNNIFTYTLFSVLNKNYKEKGQSYNFYCKNFNNNIWYIYNRNGINLVENKDDILEGNKALLLVYKRI